MYIPLDKLQSPNIRILFSDHNTIIDQRIDNSPSLEIWKTSFRVRISGETRQEKERQGREKDRRETERQGEREKDRQGRRDRREKETCA
jgi:hypothetical protein